MDNKDKKINKTSLNDLTFLIIILTIFEGFQYILYDF
ncbi:MAG: hypothetical protein BWY70_01986 [Bacteroidetes bacterium ADurb.Bin408]|nr:MAG: hypothetical protein BWY70_01986 [Bacteroidetes bacterium ADurb.Bin408]